MNEPTYSDGSYEPGHYVESLHDTHRWDRWFRPVPNHLPAVWGDVSSDHSDIDLYWQGTAMRAAILLSIAIVIWVALLFAYPIACCKLLCCGRRRDGFERAIVSPMCARWWTWIAGLGYCAAIVAAFVTTAHLDHGVDQTPAVLDQVSSLLTNANDSTNTMLTSAGAMHDSATQIANLNWGTTKEGPQLATSIAELSAEAAAAVQGTGPAVTKLADNTNDASHFLRKYKEIIATISWAWAAVCLALMLGIMVSLAGCGFCECTNKVLNGIGLVFLVSTWACVAAFQVASYAMADYCISPSYYTNNVVSNTLQNLTPEPGMSLDTIELVANSTEFYMLSCGPNPTEPAIGVYGNAVEAQHDMGLAQSTINQLQTHRSDVSIVDRKRFDTLMASLNGSALTAQSAANDAASRLECGTVLPVWQQVVELVCTDATNQGLLPLWAATLSAAVMFTIVMMGGVAVCRNHPAADAVKRREQEQRDLGLDPLGHDYPYLAAQTAPSGLPYGGAPTGLQQYGNAPLLDNEAGGYY